MFQKFFNFFYPFVILLPLFFYFTDGLSIHFDARGGVQDEFVIPFSILFAAPVIVVGVGKVIRNMSTVLFLFPFLFLFFSVGAVTDYNYAVVARMVFFVLLIVGFEVLIKNKMMRALRVSHIDGVVLNADGNSPPLFENVLLNSILLMVFIVVASYFLIKAESFIFHDVVVYNFRQYFSLISVLVIGMLADMKRWTYLIFAACLSFFLSSISDNLTAIAILCFILIFIAVDKCLVAIGFSKYSNYLILIMIAMAGINHVFSIWFVDIYGSESVLRFNKISRMYDGASLVDFLFPFYFNLNLVSMGYHNQLAVTLGGAGLFGVMAWYLFLFGKLSSICGFVYTKISIASVIFIGGLFILPLYHPYTAILIAYFISYYNVASEISGYRPSVSKKKWRRVSFSFRL